jgi:hypothetical protein
VSQRSESTCCHHRAIKMRFSQNLIFFSSALFVPEDEKNRHLFEQKPNIEHHYRRRPLLSLCVSSHPSH